MTQQTQTPPLVIPPEVHQFAVEQGVAEFLLPLADAVQRVFPDARRFAVLVEDDPEIANDRHIVFEVDVVGYSVEQYLEADSRWGREFFRICTSPWACVFRLVLDVVEP